MIEEKKETGFKSGFVTLVGRPNAGKSTLLNALLGKKYAITSDKAQTTRHRLRGILNDDSFQMIIVDTPGLHKPIDALGEELNRSSLKALEDVDCIAMLVDASKQIGKGDRWVVEQISRYDIPLLGVLTKTDLVDEECLQQQVKDLEELLDWHGLVTLSAQEEQGLDMFVDQVVAVLPEGPLWYPRDMKSDQPDEILVAEFIREKILLGFRDEVPHAIGVACDEISYDKARRLYLITATVYVERESQKGMIIGKGGDSIKHIGMLARQDIEEHFGTKVYLELKVKTKKNWRKDYNQILKFGYGEGAY